MELKKVRFSLLDGVIVVGIVFLAVVGYWFFSFRGGGGDSVWVNFTFEARGMNPAYEGVPVVGDTVYCSVRGYYLGVITDVWFEPATTIVTDIENRVFREEILPHLINVYIAVRAAGYETDDRIVIAGDGYEIRVGLHMYLKGRGYAAEGFCVALATVARVD